MKKYSDLELKKTIPKLAPNELAWHKTLESLFWLNPPNAVYSVQDTELLHVCWMIAQRLPASQAVFYRVDVNADDDWQTHLTWLIEAHQIEMN